MKRETGAGEPAAGECSSRDGQTPAVTTPDRRTARRRDKDKELHQLLSAQQTVLDHVGIGLGHLRDDRFVWVNRRIGELFGFGDAMLSDISIEELFDDKNDYEELRLASLPPLAKGERFVGEYRMRRGDGKVFRAKLSANAVDTEDAAAGAVWVVEDITRQKEISDHLLLADTLFEITTEGILICDADRKIIAANPAFTAITGRAAEEVTGKDMGILGSEKHDAAFYERMWDTVAKSGRWEGEVWNRRKDGEAFLEWLSLMAITDDKGRIERYVAVLSDITRRKQDEARIAYHAHYDALTGLPNRQLLEERLGRVIDTAGDKGAALICLDLDNLKNINESLGHTYGDMILIEAARKISTGVRSTDTVARFGGDVFMMVLQDVGSEDEATQVARQLIAEFSRPITLEGHGQDVFVTASIGIALYPHDGADVNELLRNADTAAIHAKQRGRNNFQFFTEDMNVRALERLHLENRLRNALERGEMVLHYQPKVELRGGHIVGVEALIRWRDPEHGLVPPGKFIPLAEETGLIVPLGDWVLREACAQAKAWRDAGLKPIRMAVNLSALHLSKKNLVAEIAQILEEADLPPDILDVEITESSLMANAEETVSILRELRAMGVHLAADDFGTGYSSLNYLRNFPLDSLKIDSSFISDIGSGGSGEMLVSAIIAIGQSLGLEVVAEGVENEAQLSFLRQQWCDQIQGFLFCRPVPAEEIEVLLRQGRRL